MDIVNGSLAIVVAITAVIVAVITLGALWQIAKVLFKNPGAGTFILAIIIGGAAWWISHGGMADVADIIRSMIDSIQSGGKPTAPK